MDMDDEDFSMSIKNADESALLALDFENLQVAISTTNLKYNKPV